ncbi:hypothetical protein HGRIS_002004 [Hohenbuehelia grisea]|uniref:Uncharacterized protein n=1 Tax=Hohenbuehelia grisea TaxID=104357 RepID=A0ABR3JJ45_9AGAR
MPFFENSSDFEINGGTMNDIKGNQNVTRQNTTDNRSNCNNTTTHTITDSYNNARFIANHNNARYTNNADGTMNLNSGKGFFVGNAGRGTIMSNTGRGTFNNVGGSMFNHSTTELKRVCRPSQPRYAITAPDTVPQRQSQSKLGPRSQRVCMDSSSPTSGAYSDPWQSAQYAGRDPAYANQYVGDLEDKRSLRSPQPYMQTPAGQAPHNSHLGYRDEQYPGQQRRSSRAPSRTSHSPPAQYMEDQDSGEDDQFHDAEDGSD